MKMPDKVEKVNFGQIGPPPIGSDTRVIMIIMFILVGIFLMIIIMITIPGRKLFCAADHSWK